MRFFTDMNRFYQNIARHAAIIIACATIVACGSHQKIEKVKPTQPSTTKQPVQTPQTKPEEKTARPPFIQKHFTTTSGTKWGDIDYEAEPWVSNTSRPIEITRGLQKRHFAIWQWQGPGTEKIVRVQDCGGPFRLQRGARDRED